MKQFTFTELLGILLVACSLTALFTACNEAPKPTIYQVTPAVDLTPDPYDPIPSIPPEEVIQELSDDVHMLPFEESDIRYRGVDLIKQAVLLEIDITPYDTATVEGLEALQAAINSTK